MYAPFNVRPSSGAVLVALRRETGLVQSAVQPFSGAVAGKHAAGAIRAVRRGGQPQDQHARLRVTKCRDRLAPIIAVAIGAALDGGDVGAMLAQSGTAPALHNFAL